ncbi:Kre5p PWA37_002357 [Arxiozyma heterogenica]|uniref:Kre5p n=1 Tax=Arxiozyma heterogenica TaxID=278026 RepID=UPI002F135283
MLLKIKRPLLILINILAFQVFFVDSIKLTTVERFTSNHSDPVTIWSILNHIVLDNKEGRKLLNDLYPIITGLDEFSESAEDYYITENFEEKEDIKADSTLFQKVIDTLKTFDKTNKNSKFETTFSAQLFKTYYDLYPFGFLDYVDPDLYKVNHFTLNGKIFDKPDDSFYLRSDDLKKQSKLTDLELLSENDNPSAIIGTNSQAPLLIFYGCPNLPDFKDFSRNLFIEATETEKIRFFWKPICNINSTFHINQDFSTSFTLKKNEEINKWQLLENLIEVPKKFKDKLILKPINNQNISDLDIKVTSLITRFYKKNGNFSSTIKYFQSIVNNFPLLINTLVDTKLLKGEKNKIIKSNSILKQYGIDFHMLGIFINGQNIKLSSLNHYSLLNTIFNEWKRMVQLKKYLLDYKLSDKTSININTKSLLKYFTDLSILSLRESQPIKIDLHRIKSFSDNVIYFNDIEKNSQYDELSTDIESFLAEKSKFGEIPEYRKNWNEIIFVINFDKIFHTQEKNDLEALTGLLRSLRVVKEGYPQRIGLLPIGSSKSSALLSKIYDFKLENDLDSLITLLEDIASGNIDNSLFSENYRNVPDTKSLLKSLDIRMTTSIIINGEIYPFKYNSWYYLIAKVIKKDTAFLKNEIKKELKSGKNRKNIDVRGILHLKSSITKNEKYTPNYFSNSIYTTMDNTILTTHKQRIIECINNNNLNILHTITLFDNFGTVEGLQRLSNLLSTKFEGVRVRIFHSGDLSDSTWKKLKSQINKYREKSEQLKFLDSLTKKSIQANHNKKSLLQITKMTLHKWLPDVPPSYFDSKLFLVLNGRFIHFSKHEILTTTEFESIIKRESKRTLDTIFALENIFPGFSETALDPDFVEMISALLSKLVYHGSQYNNDGFDFTTETVLLRFNIEHYLHSNGFTIFDDSDHNSVEKLIDVTIIVDPVEERTQKLLSFIPFLEKMNIVNFKIVLLPTENLPFIPNERVFIPTIPNRLLTKEIINAFDVEVDIPDHFAVSNLSQFDGVIVESYVYDSKITINEGNVHGIGGLSFNVLDEHNEIITSFTSMSTFGYGQFMIHDFQKKYHIVCITPGYDVELVSNEIYSDLVDEGEFSISNLNMKRITILVTNHDKAIPENRISMESTEINIFTTLAHSDLEQSNFKKNVLQICASDLTKNFTFWLLEDAYMNEELHDFATIINNISDINGKVKFVKYEWPRWLRPQRYCERKLDISRFLFLDVLFPSDIKKIVYMNLGTTDNLLDPEKIIRSETKKAPFSMFKMEVDGYWNYGYWEKRLKNNGYSFYSTDPVFLIDLEEIRSKDIGDLLRIHYQRLSADANSLVNIGQDLLNDIQSEVPISGLKRSLKKNKLLLSTSKQILSRWENQIIETQKTLQRDKKTKIENTNNIFNTLSYDKFHDEL